MPATVRFFEDVGLGDEAPTLERRPSTEAVRLFVEVSRRQRIGLFTEPAAAEKAGFPHPLVPGDMLMAYITQALRRWAPEATIEVLDVIFRQPASHMELLSVGGVVTDTGDASDGRITCDVYVLNERGERLVVGTAHLTLPSRG